MRWAARPWLSQPPSQTSTAHETVSNCSRTCKLEQHERTWCIIVVLPEPTGPANKTVRVRCRCFFTATLLPQQSLEQKRIVIAVAAKEAAAAAAPCGRPSFASIAELSAMACRTVSSNVERKSASIFEYIHNTSSSSSSKPIDNIKNEGLGSWWVMNCAIYVICAHTSNVHRSRLLGAPGQQAT